MYSTSKNAATKTVEVEGTSFAYRGAGPATGLPTSSSLHLAQLLPDAQLSIYPGSGHGGIFQHHDLFAARALEFLH